MTEKRKGFIDREVFLAVHQFLSALLRNRENFRR
jgi:hypothetical protein